MTERAGRRPAIAVVTLVAVMAAAAACRGDDQEATPTAPSSAVATAATAAVISVATGVSASAGTHDAAPPTTVPRSTPAPATAPRESASPADTGVPGLNSADAFCAAWSRFGGSWQVVVVSAAFGGEEAAMRLEVIASTVTGDAYDMMFEVWPEPLAAERDVVADAYFGPFHRRSVDARAALVDAGADESAIEDLASAWVGALARRDPAEPTISVDVPAELSRLVDAATATFAAQRVPLPADPTMVITAETPLTDDYLTTACPGEGTIVGQDRVDG